MKTKIVRIGNSRGLRIPKPLLEQTGLEGDVEIRVEDQSLVISPLRDPRSDWGEAFEAMAVRGDDRLLDEDWVSTEWDELEWEWK
jgi:antitoxin MazE